MGSNTFRERIILADKVIIESVSFVQKVVRTLKAYEDLSNYANTQLPLVALVGGLPDPNNHVSMQNGQVDQSMSVLTNHVVVYFEETDEEIADQKVSSYADDMWAAFYVDPTRGGLCVFTEVKMNPNWETWDPYVAFEMSIIHHYQHTTGGI